MKELSADLQLDVYLEGNRADCRYSDQGARCRTRPDALCAVSLSSRPLDRNGAPDGHFGHDPFCRLSEGDVAGPIGH